MVNPFTIELVDYLKEQGLPYEDIPDKLKTPIENLFPEGLEKKIRVPDYLPLPKKPIPPIPNLTGYNLHLNNQKRISPDSDPNGWYFLAGTLGVIIGSTIYYFALTPQGQQTAKQIADYVSLLFK